MSPTTSATQSSGGTSISQTLSSNNALNQQQFLSLLITQLTNQDPTSPMDDQQFLAQMAQFSTVEGVTNIGTTMDREQGAQLVGKTIGATVVTSGVSQPVSGVVSAVNFQSDGVHLTVGGQDVTLSQVTSVSD